MHGMWHIMQQYLPGDRAGRRATQTLLVLEVASNIRKIPKIQQKGAKKVDQCIGRVTNQKAMDSQKMSNQFKRVDVRSRSVMATLLATLESARKIVGALSDQKTAEIKVKSCRKNASK